MKFLCVLSSLLACVQILAVGRNISFNRLDVEDGLSSAPVYDILPDPAGVMWMATSQGLKCYDGNGVFGVSPNLQPGVDNASEYTKQLAGNGKGLLYVLYGRGVFVMNHESGDFSPFYPNLCNCIAYDDGLWLGARNELLYSDGLNASFDSIYTLPDEDGEITALLVAQNGDIWLGSSHGKVIVLERSSEGVCSVVSCDMASGMLSSHIFCMYEDSHGTVWVGTLSDGALGVSRDGGHMVFRHDRKNRNTISSDYVRAFCEDDLGNIWIGTYAGLDCLDRATGHVRRFNSELMRHDAISNPSVWSITKDSQGTLWVGTYFDGVSYFNPEYDIYRQYPVSSKEGEGLSSPVISGLITDSSGRLWVATEGGGLNSIDRETGEIRWYNATSPKGKRLSENNVKDMVYVESDNTIWVGLHWGGVNSLDIDTDRVRTYRAGDDIPSPLPSDDVIDIADYGDSLIVRMKNCTSIMDKRTGNCRPVRPLSGALEQGGDISMSFVDSDKNIWVSRYSSKSLSILAPPYVSEVVCQRESASGESVLGKVLCMMQDASGKIWASSADNGLFVYSSHDGVFVSFGDEDLLGGAEYMAVSPLSGNIICSSEYGFLHFNPITHQVCRYSKENGFPSDNGKTRCISVLSDSEIFIGGYGGLVCVNEKDLDIPRKPYRLFFTGLVVNGEKIEAWSDILPNPILQTSSVVLPSNTASIDLYFSSSNRIAANEEQLEYCLEGFDKNWKPVEGERKISYTNLPWGSYRLLLRPSSAAQSELCPMAEFLLKISTPWYATWLAKSIYLLLLVVAILLIIRFYTSKVRMQEFLKHEKERAEDLENLNQAKLRFFTNISHEIRTPLTIIIAEIESMLQKHNFTPSLYRKVLGIYKNSLSLRELVSELMEFRKQEQGQLRIKAAPHNMVFFINEFYLLFSEYAAGKGVKLSLTKETERLEVWYDQIQMQKVLNNILSNSIKFTPAGGEVEIRVSATGTSAIIEISDTGCGIPAKDLKNIFDRFYQVEYSADINTGTGIGLAVAQGIVKLHSGMIDVVSTEGKGSLFRIVLPLGYSHFSQEQLEESPEMAMKLDLLDKISLPEGKDVMSDSQEAEEPKKGHVIVIAEDNRGVLGMLYELFSPFYKVVTVTDGVSALDAVRENLPSLVISDVMMPGMSGTELCKTIKNDPSLCHIPVVLLTARVDVEQNMEGLQQGADDYITKPFNSTLLLSRCNNLVNSRIMLQEKYSRDPSSSAWMLATNRMDDEFLQKVTRIVTANMDNTAFDISDLIKAVGMSRTSFFRKLKAITGQTPTEFILTLRIRKAAELLLSNPEMNIGEISDYVGFNTSKYFAKCFKEHYGKSPLAWRKEKTENKDI